MTEATAARTGNKFDYTVHLHRMDGRYILQIRELSLFVENAELSAAYEELERRKQDILEKYAALGKESEIPWPDEARVKDTAKRIYAPFLVKTAVVALVGVFLIAASHITILYAIREAPRHLGQKAGQAAMKGMISGLEKFAQRDLTPEREERLRLAIRAAIPKLQPFAKEIQPLFACAETPSGNSAR